VAEESGKKPEDLEVKPEKAGDVKGGVLPHEPGGSGRTIAAKHSHKTKHGVKGPIQKMPHE
jgi:hypothetical protein